ncbi:zinc finger protein 3 [Electrophorus electricus]|uniref:C2H2-type domain-containing protein n=1 Tax=Electrophorus electricus TaxID=8005 RepID=A0AAY5EXX5_ELEEL|nr:zinc finger protein 3 [Electrophorus electricus]
MANHESSPNSALVAELSLSFQDELTASIQNALGVAVEIAVVEITKLVGQVLRDVRDQMHETLSDNKSLKSRLRAAETELRAVRALLVEAQRQTPAITVNTGCSGSEQMSGSADVDLNEEQRVDSLLDVEQKYDVSVSSETNSSVYQRESFCEIREDGSVCTQDLKPDLTEEESSAPELEEAKDIKEVHQGIQDNPSHFDRACVGVTMGPGMSAILVEGSLSREAGRAVPEVAVKVEDGEHCGGPESSSLSEREEFGSDCLSLAQSRLLEDWRPDPLQLQSCQSDSYASSSSTALADASLFPGDIPDLDFLSSAAPSQQDAFPAPLSHRDVASISNHAPHQLYPTSSSGPSQHVCKLCGQSFHLQEDLRRHRSLLHPKQAGHQHKSPKRSLFPPGRSPYHCSQCGRDFNRMEHLKIHQRIHTGERPYACSVCSARFRHSWALTRHFRIHTGEKPYTCAQCGKTFRNCGGLRFHQRSHARGGVA